MESIIEIIHANAHMAPFIVFGLLILAGFNLPVSEDLMLFISAMLAVDHPDRFYQLFLGVFLGAYLSDLICYWLGRILGPKFFKIKFFANMITEHRLHRIEGFYHKYGFFTLIVGRFIPFGVRNGLFLTAGLGRMNFFKFMSADFVACSISCTTFFYLYYTYGESVVRYVKKGNIIIFSIAALVGLFFVVRRYLRKSRQEKIV